jgi:hypothetical protein
MSCYITLDEDKRAKYATELGLPTLKGAGVRAPKKDKTEPEWKTDHKEMFESHDLPWPAPWSEYPEIDPSGMFRREAESTVFLHLVFPPLEEEGMIEFLDINLSLPRLTAGCFTELGETKKSAWRRRPPTMTGSSKIVVRARLEGKCLIRCLDGVEYFRMMGWCDSDWVSFRWETIFDDVFHFTETMSNLAGNAFSAFHYGAFEAALLSTWGKYGKHAGQGVVRPEFDYSGLCSSTSASDIDED